MEEVHVHKASVREVVLLSRLFLCLLMLPAKPYDHVNLGQSLKQIMGKVGKVCLVHVIGHATFSAGLLPCHVLGCREPLPCRNTHLLVLPQSLPKSHVETRERQTIIPHGVPFMVKLLCYSVSEDSIFLHLEHVQGEWGQHCFLSVEHPALIPTLPFFKISNIFLLLLGGWFL